MVIFISTDSAAARDLIARDSRLEALLPQWDSHLPRPHVLMTASHPSHIDYQTATDDLYIRQQRFQDTITDSVRRLDRF